MKKKAVVVRWVFSWASGCGPEIEVYVRRLEARLEKRAYQKSGWRCGPVTRIEVPL